MHLIILKHLGKYLSVLDVKRKNYNFQITNLHKKNPLQNMIFLIFTMQQWALKQYELGNIIP